jgi:hypothetical protein
MSPAPMTVTDARLDHEADGTLTLGGTIDGHRLFWTMPPRETIALRGEPFVSALLVSAMSTGRDLVLPDNAPVDAGFLGSLDELQTIFVRWFPHLRRVAITARVAERGSVAGRMTGYSAGVDSSYTVLRLADRLDGVVLLDGIEFGTPNPVLMAGVDDTLRRTMEARGLPLHLVRTNAKAMGKALGGKWSHFIGGTLSSVPHALGLAEYWIASSNSWENLRPYGTHPITDPRWSSAATVIHHHGCEALRIEKVEALRVAPDLLQVIRVCFQGDAYNCGVCHKCLQTAAAFRALQVECDALPPLRHPRVLRTIAVEHDGDLVDWVEIALPGLASRDPMLANELSRLLRRYHLRQAARRLDEVATGGFFRRLLVRGAGR